MAGQQALALKGSFQLSLIDIPSRLSVLPTYCCHLFGGMLGADGLVIITRSSMAVLLASVVRIR